MSRAICFCVAFIFLLSHHTLMAQVMNKKLTGQSFTGEITVSAGSEAVWPVLTDMQKLSKAMGYEYKGAPLKFSKPGDHAKLTIWGDSGAYVLIYSKPGEELRFMWEPDNASYICQQRWRLVPAGKGTKIIFEERYTESGAQSEADIAAQVKAYNEALVRLKTSCEGK